MENAVPFIKQALLLDNLKHFFPISNLGKVQQDEHEGKMQYEGISEDATWSSAHANFL